ncbi:MAG: Unknown protein [uncultured Thiotrichaceae bacterium]|uniref:O-antigen ligase-related domain-containing protein n=1 Tax=uncultured Thiotrichaceae bacterium TaxID=298394 RepID=A0A6S6T0B3_9GAMM|nr:MAG: Unknown protein [uncultured Thiotrichaceae bacterium]
MMGLFMLSNLRSVFVFIFVLAFSSSGYLELEETFPAFAEYYWFVLLFGAALFFLITQPDETLGNLRLEHILWLLFYTLTLVIAFILSSRSEVVMLFLITLVKAFSAMIFLMLLITDKQSQKGALWALVLVIIISSFNNVYEFFDESVGWSAIPGRAAGWHFNPNKSGNTIVMSLIFAGVLVSRKFFWPLVIIATIGTIVTFSRTSWLILFIVVAGLSIIRSAPLDKPLNLLNFSAGKFIGMIISAIIAGGFIVMIYSGEAYEMMKGTPVEGYLNADTLHRISGGTEDGSTSERKHVVIEALKLGLVNPLFGSGLGASIEWDEAVAPHNEFAMVFAERGMFGLVIYLWLYIIVWTQAGRYGKLYVLIVAIASLASHNHLDTPAVLFFFVLALFIKDEDFPIKT